MSLLTTPEARQALIDKTENEALQEWNSFVQSFQTRHRVKVVPTVSVNFSGLGSQIESASILILSELRFEKPQPTIYNSPNGKL